MADGGKLQGTCSVCLRQIQLRGFRPIRHGFSAVGVRHGQSGGYHTGPCGGANFPHLGISTDGTRWALDRARANLDVVRADLVKLATNPDLTWYPKKYDVRGGRPDLSRPVVLKHGQAASYGTGAPSYDSEHRRQKVMLEGRQHELECAIAEYERVLATWSSGKYPVSAVPEKVETTHMATPRKNVRGAWTGVLCRFTRQGYPSEKLVKTDDPSKVTCKRCRSLLGLPPL